MQWSSLGGPASSQLVHARCSVSTKYNPRPLRSHHSIDIHIHNIDNLQTGALTQQHI